MNEQQEPQHIRDLRSQLAIVIQTNADPVLIRAVESQLALELEKLKQ